MSLYSIMRETGRKPSEIVRAFHEEANKFKKNIHIACVAGLTASAALSVPTENLIPVFLATVADMGGQIYGESVVIGEVDGQVGRYHLNPNAGPCRWEAGIRTRLASAKPAAASPQLT